MSLSLFAGRYQPITEPGKQAAQMGEQIKKILLDADRRIGKSKKACTPQMIDVYRQKIDLPAELFPDERKVEAYFGLFKFSGYPDMTAHARIDCHPQYEFDHNAITSVDFNVVSERRLKKTVDYVLGSENPIFLPLMLIQDLCDFPTTDHWWKLTESMPYGLGYKLRRVEFTPITGEKGLDSVPINDFYKMQWTLANSKRLEERVLAHAITKVPELIKQSVLYC